MYSIIKQSLLFFLLVFLQVSLLRTIHLFGYAMPLPYIYFIIQLAGNMNRNFVLILSALIGLSIDIFSHTLGLNMFSCVIVGFLRFYLLQLFMPNNLLENYCPSLITFGKFRFFYYSFLITLLHQIILFTMELFSLFDPLLLIFRVVGSVILTMILIFTFDGLFTKK